VRERRLDTHIEMMNRAPAPYSVENRMRDVRERSSDTGDMKCSLESAYDKLRLWCRAQGYAGHDPFDGLKSRLFQATPFKSSRVARLAWLQLFKRSPINLRTVAGVPRESNSKGLALFALAALSRFRSTGGDEDRNEVRSLLAELLSQRVAKASGCAWGYNFDWQNRAFLAPQGTPTIVPTAFAARAFYEAAVALNEKSYANVVRDCCNFIIHDLNETEASPDELCWSYSPLDHTRVFNASLLAAESLASAADLTGDETLRGHAIRAARYVVRRQERNGSWTYGADGFQSWSDNFHTAFILTSLSRIINTCGVAARDEFAGSLSRGYEYWVAKFFTDEGWPKYYPDRLYPADAHSAGAALSTFVELSTLDARARERAERVACWAIENMMDRRGYFYYQRHRFYTVRTPYIRWAQAWMLYGIGRLLEKG
jgi:hypothetical protein